LIGWDEILEGGLAPNAAVMSWRGIDGGIAAAKAGHDVVMAPTSNTYLDYYQNRISNEPRTTGGYLPLSKVYEFEPVPDSLSAVEAAHILGPQAQLWAEFIPNRKHMEYMAYPRLCALSEVGWSQKSDKNWDDFLTRLKTHLQMLDILDVHYSPLETELKPAGQWKSGEIGETLMTRDWPVAISEPGDYKVLFSYSGGESRLDIAEAQLVMDGQVVATDTHAGRTGGDTKDNAYRFRITNVPAGSKWLIRAKVRADGSSDSNGDIFLVKS
jgi:hexosaminidase